MQTLERTPTTRLDGLTLALLGTGTLAFLVALYFVLTSPPEVSQGYVYRIVFVHISTAWVGYLASFGCLAYSVAYLVIRKPAHDRMAAVMAELTLLFMGLTLVQGMLYARPTWGVYWEWEPRLTTTAILFAVYVGYFVLRAAIEDPELRAKAAAAVGILGVINVPISYMSVIWWRSLHQVQSFNLTTGKSQFDPAMLPALLVTLTALTLLFFGFARFKGYLAAQSAHKEVMDG